MPDCLCDIEKSLDPSVSHLLHKIVVEVRPDSLVV